ncbi:uncharacterized protein ColSpa_04241 [Colletotrichum spaethianum]|uniref:Uncharacterized protein n=1 Tax=Colletotrichum spaethianum TaxID=700344 RepID=A0AA37NZ47_9PEZI|nr:uncharacterized protein ColSpa_04241 [Colletotrichum spaethianum]GKT44060.1 hypothetical protein ColSpa_04241 [Colletotrichum spaethianum]
MDTIDRSVERMRLRAIDLDRDCALKLAQLKALVASGPATKPSADKSYDYSTDSPTPHTISNWDSTLEEDRLSSYSFTHVPTPSALVPAALAEWDTSSSSSPVSSVAPVSSVSVTPPRPSSPVLTPIKIMPDGRIRVRCFVSHAPDPLPMSLNDDAVLRKFARNVTQAHFTARGEQLPASWTPPSFAHVSSLIQFNRINDKQGKRLSLSTFLETNITLLMLMSTLISKFTVTKRLVLPRDMSTYSLRTVIALVLVPLFIFPV